MDRLGRVRFASRLHPSGEIYELECNKEQAGQIEWNNVTEEGMTKICTYQPSSL